MNNKDNQKRQDEFKMPNPQDANQKPSEDMSNEIKKGGKISDNFNNKMDDMMNEIDIRPTPLKNRLDTMATTITSGSLPSTTTYTTGSGYLNARDFQPKPLTKKDIDIL